MKILFLYYCICNVAAFCAMGIDKAKAKAGVWRISEGALLGLAFLGGALGLWCGMYFFHHKTRHKKFTVGVPFLLLLHGFFLFLLLHQ